MQRGFDFLKRKYYEVLMPNLLVQLSDKLGTVLDVVVVGFLIGSTQLPALNAVSPFVLFSSIIYSLYGQGGSLLAIKAKSDWDSEKANDFFYSFNHWLFIGLFIIYGFNFYLCRFSFASFKYS